MRNYRVRRAALLIGGSLTLLGASPARAAEAQFYAATHELSASFYVIGGQYSLYLYAKRPVLGAYGPESRACIFGGNLQRIWPTHDAMSLGAGVTISTYVGWRIGPKPITLPAGLYTLYVAPLTDCDWKFLVNSTSENAAGLTPVQMLRNPGVGRDFALTASLSDEVQFYAQFRTEHDQKAPVSGRLEIINADKVVQTFPLQVGKDTVTGADAFFQNVRWEQSDARYLGTNTARFVVKIGSSDFTSTGDFTLTR
jgi:hypothetical protein